MESTALYYALSTIAQCAAALAALIGFFGLWRLDFLRQVETLAKQDFQLPHLGIEGGLPNAPTRRAAYQTEQRHLIRALVIFLIGTFAVLAVAIGLIPFAEALSTWVWPMRGFILAASLWLGVAPAYVMLQAFGRAELMRRLLARTEPLLGRRRRQ
jgi:hypothetical protein